MHALSSIRTLLFVALSGLLLFACRKDEQFTDEPGIELVFSADTVLFDTVFTTVGTITKRFTARNPSSNAVRVDIFLEGGTPSPYRINVDGASGTTFNDVEILGGDSIFVFVEATLGQSGANGPFVIEDDIFVSARLGDALPPLRTQLHLARPLTAKLRDATPARTTSCCKVA